MSSQVKPIPQGMHSVTPHLVCSDAIAAMAFYTRAFNAVEVSRMMAGPTLMHASMQIGDSMIMLAEASPSRGMPGPKTLGGSAVFVHLYVPDVDAIMQQAVSAGATVTMPLMDMFWGDRYGQLEDPFGHRWSLATHTADLSPDEIDKAMMAMMQPPAP